MRLDVMPSECSIAASIEPGAEKAETLRMAQRFDQHRTIIGTEVPDRSCGAMTTRRSGSSPSERLVHAVDLDDRVVDRLAIGGRHRLERLGLA